MIESKIDIKPTDIDATLTDGQIFSGKGWTAVLIATFVLAGIGLICVLVMVIGIPLTMGGYDDESIATIIGVGVSCSLCFIVTIILRIWMSKWIKVVSQWLEDAVILKAQSKKIDSAFAYRSPTFFAIATAIQVTFFYDGHRYVRQSEYKGEQRRLKVYTKYADKEITIAYSPKYDRVMLIKFDNKMT